MNRKQVFKEYNQNQATLLPESLDDFIPKNHKARVISNIVDRLDLSSIYDTYKGGGTSSYDPRLMFKIILFAYCDKIFSSREIEKALHRDVAFMWIAAKQKPDFRTINNFRTNRLLEIFASSLEILHEEGFIDLKSFFLDGTFIRANANKYSYVWSKNSKRFSRQVKSRVRELLKEIDANEEYEDTLFNGKSLMEEGEEITSEKIKEYTDKLQQTLDSTNTDDKASIRENKEIEKNKKKLEKENRKLKKYEKQLEIADGRSSYSKTDQDATFVKMKEDQYKNSPLKPGYNVQIATENQYVLNYGLYQIASDKTTMIPTLENAKDLLPQMPKQIVADAGYGTSENYDYLEREGLEPYVKYPDYEKEKSLKWQRDKFKSINMPYDNEKDEFTGPKGRKLRYRENSISMTKSGYKVAYRIYESEGCDGCELRKQCHNNERDRTIWVSRELLKHKEKARDKLDSKRGEELRSQRSYDVESVFGIWKHNNNFKRFRYRGLDKCKIELGLMSLAHNISKMILQMAK